MQSVEVVRAWGKILTGYPPVLSIELTKQCPLSCPGCYAYQPDHLGGVSLESLSEFKGEELIQGVLDLVDRYRPMGVFFVGGEPLVRFRELTRLLPILSQRKVRSEVVTSAVRPIPAEWSEVDGLNIVVSIDGLQPEHDERRKPATYERILKHIEGHRIIVHCTITGQMLCRPDYLEEFVELWGASEDVREIRLSLFTPQKGETGPEVLKPAGRAQVIGEMRRLSELYPKLRLPGPVLEAFSNPPESPKDCVFAAITHCTSADLTTMVEPCQLGGTPKCTECGCLASMGLHAVGRHRLGGLVSLNSIMQTSAKIGQAVRSLRDKGRLELPGKGYAPAPKAQKNPT